MLNLPPSSPHLFRATFLRILYVIFLFLYLLLITFPSHAQGIKQTVDSITAEYTKAKSAQNDTLAALLLGEIGKALWGTYPDSAMVYEQEMLRLAESIKFERGKAIAYNNIGYIYRKKSRYDECLEYSHKALSILEPLGDKSMAAWCYHNIANVHHARGRMDLALENHFKALRLREEIGEKTSVAWSLSNISDIYRDQGYKEQALQYTQQAVAKFQETGDKHGAAVALNSIGVMLQEQGRYEEAVTKFLQALALDEASEHGIGQIWSLRYLGEVSMLQRRYDQAQNYFERGLTISRNLNDRKQSISALLNLGRLFEQTQQIPRAFACAKEALALADSVHSEQSRQESYQLLSNLYAATGNYESAYRYHIQAASLRDSLFNISSAKKIAEISTQYEADKRKQEIALLTKDNALQEAALRRDAMTRNGLIVGVLVLLVIAVLLVQRYRLAERARTELRIKNEEITRQQHILEDQAAEIEITNTQLNEQNIALQQLNIEKNEFLGIAAHDLKNPLTSITMNASGLRDNLHRFSPEAIKERLGFIVISSQRMASIITNLLDINAIETGNLNIVCKPTKIQPLVQHSVADYADRAAQKSISLTLQDAFSERGMESPVLNIDAGVFAEIIDNLISNAIKYSPQGKQVIVRVEQQEHILQIAVKDEGPGISEDDKKRLFQKFARLSAQPTGGEHSTGLGLSIVKRFAEAMGGRVGCDSVLGSGATFFVEFPVSCE
jgi:signal transduction histidine kinase